MNVGSLKDFFKVIVGFVCFVGVMDLSCGPTSPATPSTPLSDLMITDNQFTGWRTDTVLVEGVYYTGATPFVDSTIHDFVDGGSSDYCGTCNGHGNMKAGIATYIKYPDSGYKLFGLVIDYGTASAANAEFKVWVNKKAPQTPVSIPPFLITTAVAYEANGGAYVYAHFSNYFIEMQLSNYNGMTDLAVADANTFLTYFQSKIK
jgi:hypothetical protein